MTQAEQTAHRQSLSLQYKCAVTTHPNGIFVPIRFGLPSVLQTVFPYWSVSLLNNPQRMTNLIFRRLIGWFIHTQHARGSALVQPLTHEAWDRLAWLTLAGQNAPEHQPLGIWPRVFQLYLVSNNKYRSIVLKLHLLSFRTWVVGSRDPTRISANLLSQRASTGCQDHIQTHIQINLDHHQTHQGWVRV
jgi:hypothetical protein